MNLFFNDEDIEEILTQYAIAIGFEVVDASQYDEDNQGITLEVKPKKEVSPETYGKFTISK